MLGAAKVNMLSWPPMSWIFSAVVSLLQHVVDAVLDSRAVRDGRLREAG